MKLNLALAAALSLTNNANIFSVSAEDTLAAEIEGLEQLETLIAEVNTEEIALEEQIEELSSSLEIEKNDESIEENLLQTRFDVIEEGSDEEGGDIVLDFDAADLRVEDEEEGYDELPEGEGGDIAYTASAMDEPSEEVHTPTKHQLHHAAKIAKANKHHDMLSKAHSMKSTEKKHSKAAKAVHGSKGSKRGKMGKAHLSMPTSHSGKANKMAIHHEAKTQKTPSKSNTVKSTSQSASSSKANKSTTNSTEAVPMPIPVPAAEDDDVTELNMDPVPRIPDVKPTPQGVDTSALNGRLKQEMAEVMLGDTSHVGKGHSQSNENVAALDLLRAKSDAAAQSNGGSAVGRSVGYGIVGVCLVGSILYGMM